MPRIISVGRLVAFKGFEYLIDACAELARRNLEFTCEIIGDGPLRGDLEARIRKLKLSDRVHLLGSLSQGAVLEKLRAADIFALAFGDRHTRGQRCFSNRDHRGDGCCTSGCVHPIGWDS